MSSDVLGTRDEMGFGGKSTQTDKLSADQEVKNAPGEEGWDTGVNGIKSQGERGGLPVFDVSPEEFYNNMKLDRRKMVFKRGTPTQQYHAGTNYKQHFRIRNTKDGYMRKIGKTS